MPRWIRMGSEFHLVFLASEAQKLGLSLQCTVESLPSSRGIVVLVMPEVPLGTQTAVPAPDASVPSQKSDLAVAQTAVPETGFELDEEDAELLNRLRDKNQLGRRIVGVFEKTLSESQQKRFEALKARGIVEEFRLSDKYKNAIYRVRPSAGMENTEQNSASNGPLNGVGYLIIGDESQAKVISQQLEERIKKGEVRGLRGFDGQFYVMETSQYQQLAPRILAFLRSQPFASLSAISAGVGVSLPEVRIACEFLKDDGVLFEKKKEIFKVID